MTGTASSAMALTLVLTITGTSSVVPKSYSNERSDSLLAT